MKTKQLKQGFEKLTKEKSRIIAHIIGDGCAFVSNHDYNIKYEVKDKELLDFFEKDMLKVYGLKLTKGFNPSGKTGDLIPFLRLRSKLVYEDLLKYACYLSKNWKIKRSILTSSRIIKKEFIKSFCDDEGTVTQQGNKGIVKLYSINLEGLKQIQKILIEFNIDSKIYSGYGLKRNVYAVVITDLELFYDSIGFNLTRKQERLKYFVLNIKK